MITLNKTNYYTKEEVAKRLHCTTGTLSNKITRSGVKGVYFGRRKYFTTAEMEELLRTNSSPVHADR